MTNYRVATGPEEPLAVDAALAASQATNQQLLLHGLIAVLTFGVWLPGLLYVLLAAPGRRAAIEREYRIELRHGQLTAGTSSNQWSVPLDAIADVSVRSGVVSLTVRGGQPKQLYGLRAPRAACEAILEARGNHLRELSGGVAGDEQSSGYPAAYRARTIVNE